MSWNVNIHYNDGETLEQSFDTEEEATNFADEYTSSEYDEIDTIDVLCDEDDDAGFYRVLHED